MASAHLEAVQQAVLKERRETTTELNNLIAVLKRAGTKAPAHLVDEIGKLERNLLSLDEELAANGEAIRSSAPPRVEPSALKTAFKRLSGLLQKSALEEQQQ